MQQHNLYILAGLLSTENFKNKHPMDAKEWLVKNSPMIREAMREVPNDASDTIEVNEAEDLCGTNGASQ